MMWPEIVSAPTIIFATPVTAALPVVVTALRGHLDDRESVRGGGAGSGPAAGRLGAAAVGGRRGGGRALLAALRGADLGIRATVPAGLAGRMLLVRGGRHVRGQAEGVLFKGGQ